MVRCAEGSCADAVLVCVDLDVGIEEGGGDNGAGDFDLDLEREWKKDSLVDERERECGFKLKGNERDRECEVGGEKCVGDVVEGLAIARGSVDLGGRAMVDIGEVALGEDGGVAFVAFMLVRCRGVKIQYSVECILANRHQNK